MRHAPELHRSAPRAAWGLAIAAALVASAIITAPTAEAVDPPPYIPRSAAGAQPGDIVGAVEAFRADLGGSNNGVGGSFPTGRREINWDGVPDNLAAPFLLPASFFNDTSPRGVELRVPFGVLEVSADASNPTDTPVRFGNIQRSLPDQLQTFSPERLFAPIGSRSVDVQFFVPGTSTPAVVKGFGAVFTDVEVQDSTKITFFDERGRRLGTFSVPPGPNGGLSFLGVSSFRSAGQGISHVRIQSGNRSLSFLTDHGERGGLDVAAMDDFIYGEPQAVH